MDNTFLAYANGLINDAARLRMRYRDKSREALEAAISAWHDAGVAPATQQECDNGWLLVGRGVAHELNSEAPAPHGVFLLGAGYPPALGGDPMVLVKCAGRDHLEPFSAEDAYRSFEHNDAYWIHISEFIYPDGAAEELVGLLRNLQEYRANKGGEVNEEVSKPGDRIPALLQIDCRPGVGAIIDAISHTTIAFVAGRNAISPGLDRRSILVVGHDVELREHDNKTHILLYPKQ